MEPKTSTSTEQNEERKLSDISTSNKNETLQTNGGDVEIEARLISHFEKLGEFETLKTKSYYINRLNPSMEINIKDIFSDRGVQMITKNTEIIRSAIKKCKNLELLINDNIKIKVVLERKKILIKGISAQEKEEFSQFIKTFIDKDSKTPEYENLYDEPTGCVTLVFQNQDNAVRVFGELMNAKFLEKPVDCMLKDGNAYLELKESQQAYYSQKMSYLGYQQNSYYPQPTMGFQPMYMPPPMMMYPTYNNMPVNYGWNRGYGNSMGRGYQSYRPNYNNRPRDQKYYTPKEEGNDQERGEYNSREDRGRDERFDRRGERFDRREGDGYRSNYGRNQYGGPNQRTNRGATFNSEDYPALS